MKIATLNVNGIRAGIKKGLIAWIQREQPDVLCLQEVKIQDDQLTEQIKEIEGFTSHFHCATVKKGYSGVACYVKKQPDAVHHGIGWDYMDGEGRFLQLDYGQLSVISLYLPSGTSSEERQQVKYKMMDYLENWMNEHIKDGREYLICGDWNIAHKEIDLKNWKGNLKNSGFLPEERAWMGKVFGEMGWVDVFRSINPNEDQFTWWSNRGQAWAKNVGWRIDYQVATPGIAAKAISDTIYKEERFSDHAPLVIEYETSL